ncbi:MAG: TonB-dependent siderophore receptor [Nostoc sp.]|uniref:TonB-dependent siderophore receptor n=1 Tax=Nostoc sp. TaxID=1180 RepID=UPI002FF5B2FC
MKQKLLKILLVTSCVWLWGTISAAATEIPKQEVQRKSVSSVLRNSSIREIRQLSEMERPITSAQQLLVQSPTPQTTPAPIIQITGVKANSTDKGVEIILETPVGSQLQVTNRSTGNNFIADVSGGQLRLPSGEVFTFRSEKPLTGITEITVTNVDANTVRVTVVGVAAMPTVELFDDNAGLVFGVASAATAISPSQQPQTPTSQTPQEKPAAQQDEPIELVVTGEQDGYNAPNATTATKTDTPLRDIPQSIQVVPRQVLEDRNVKTLNESVETVSGVSNSGDTNGATGGGRSIRGFAAETNLRNGFSQGSASFDNLLEAVGTIEQVEVLKGPASVLFGALEPGGIVNIVTKQPLSEPYYKLEFEAGNYGFYQPLIDFSGPLTADKTVLYRLIASYQGANGFQDFVNTELTMIAPSITLNLGDRTSLNLYYEYNRFFANPPRSFIPLLSDGSLPPKSFYATYPDLYFNDITTQKFGYTLKHEFSDNWQIRNNVAVVLNRNTRNEALASQIVDDRFLTGFNASEGDIKLENYFGQIDVLGKFNTGSISHQALVGFDINRFFTDVVYIGSSINNLPDLDILNPNYDIQRPEFDSIGVDYTTNTRSYGVYLQEQIGFSDNLKLLIGGRYDWLSDENESPFFDQTVQNDSAFSPRIGLVYQPSKTVSLYASYSRSFRSSGFDQLEGRAFEPSRGTQYEVGVKTDFLDGKLSTTLAAYQLTKTNVLTPDPDPQRALLGFSVQTGEQQSQGIELDIAGEILPGLKVIGSYTYTDAKVTEDNVIPVGNRLNGVPENQVSLWTTYEIQEGDLKGFGGGLGLFYVGERQGDLANSFTLRDYLRTDAALYYKRNGFKAAINVRNLFDIDYADLSYDRVTIQRANPFTITGSISCEF